MPSRSWGQNRPPFGQPLNPTHPISRGLIAPFLFARNVLNPVAGGATITTPSSNLNWTSLGTLHGRNSPTLNAGNFDIFTLSPTVTAPYCITFRFAVRQFQTAWPYISGLLFLADSSNACIRLGDASVDPAQIQYKVSYVTHTTTGPLVVVGQPYTITLNVANGAQECYQNGVLVTTSTEPSTLTVTGITLFSDGEPSDRNADGLIEYILIHNRLLSSGEAAQLAREPYCFLTPDRVSTGDGAAGPADKTPYNADRQLAQWRWG